MELDDKDKGSSICSSRTRGITTQEMAERVGLSASTVRNRIERLEDGGVIRGYHPDIDYDEAGLQLHVEIICSAPNPNRAAFAEASESVDGVVAILEVLNGKENIQIDDVGTDSDDVARSTDEISDIGLDIVNTKIIKNTTSRRSTISASTWWKGSEMTVEPTDDEDVTVSHDPETDTCPATSDSATVEPTVAVVQAMAAAEETDPTDLAPTLRGRRPPGTRPDLQRGHFAPPRRKPYRRVHIAGPPRDRREPRVPRGSSARRRRGLSGDVPATQRPVAPSRPPSSVSGPQSQLR